MTKRNK